MRLFKKYKQLKFEMHALKDRYGEVVLSFKISGREITGVLKGSAADWKFESQSLLFLQQLPSGVLYKYMFWPDGVPKHIGKIYTGIEESALKAGYDLAEKEERELLSAYSLFVPARN